MVRNAIRYYGLFRFLILILRYILLNNTIRVPGIRSKIFIRPRSTDKEVFKKIFLKQEYQFNQIKDVKYIIDAGAYIGLSAIYFKHLFHDSKIICIEASEDNFAMLKKNTQNKPEMILLNMALWKESTWLNFSESKTKQFGSKVEVAKVANSTQVKSISLDSLLEEHDFPYIDLLKIDIEGSEMELFENNYHNWLIRTKYIVIELHDRFKPGCAKSFFKAMDTINYTLHLKGENILIVNNDFSKPTQ